MYHFSESEGKTIFSFVQFLEYVGMHIIYWHLWSDINIFLLIWYLPVPQDELLARLHPLDHPLSCAVLRKSSQFIRSLQKAF